MKWPTMTPKGTLRNREDSWGFLNARAFSLSVFTAHEDVSTHGLRMRGLSCAYTPVETAPRDRASAQSPGEHTMLSPSANAYQRFSTPPPTGLTAPKRDPSQHWLSVKDTAEYIPSLFPWDDPQTKMRPAGEDVGQSHCSAEPLPARWPPHCLDWASCCLCVSPAQILLLKAWPPTCDGMRRRGLWGRSGREGGVLLNGISAGPGNRPFFLGRTEEKPEAQESPGPAARTPDLRLPASRTGAASLAVYKLPGLRRLLW